MPFNDLVEKMEVFYGSEKVISEELLFFSKTRQHIDTCMDSTRPSLAIGIESIKKSFVDARNRGVKLRYLTEITDANISYCKSKTVHVIKLLSFNILKTINDRWL